MINLNDYQYVYKKLIQKLEKNNEYYRLDHTDLLICARALEKTCEAYEQKLKRSEQLQEDNYEKE